MDDFLGNMRKDHTVKELIDHFKSQPMDFEPGEKHQYDNSGYFLLGAIVEKASGMGYEAFLKKRIFDVVGMPRTSLDDTARIIPGRAAGYSKAGDTWKNADWISMTQPFSAGTLVSTRWIESPAEELRPDTRYALVVAAESLHWIETTATLVWGTARRPAGRACARPGAPSR